MTNHSKTTKRYAKFRFSTDVRVNYRCDCTVVRSRDDNDRVMHLCHACEPACYWLTLSVLMSMRVDIRGRVLKSIKVDVLGSSAAT